MPSQTTWEKRGIYVKYEGAVTDHDVQSVVTLFQADRRYDAIRYVLHDFTDCQHLTYSSKLLEEIAACDSIAAMNTTGHRVAVFPDRPEVLRMVELYLESGFRSPDVVRVFSDSAGARAWVGA